jgi:hypothetical protein
MNKLLFSTHETLLINALLHYKFLTISQISKLLNLEITTAFMRTMEEKQLIKALKNKNFSTQLETIYFAIPNKSVDIDGDLYFQDIDLRQLGISEEDHFHIFHTVNYHILFNAYSEYRHIKINYFSAYFDAFKNKTKKNELQASGKFVLNSGESLIPNATMNFSVDEEYIYALDLFVDNEVANIVNRIRQYNQAFVENHYKLDRVIFIFKDDVTKDEGLEEVLNSNILSEYKNNFIFKTVENLENDFSLQWMSFNSKKEIDFLAHKPKTDERDHSKDEKLQEESLDAEIEEIEKEEKEIKMEESVQESEDVAEENKLKNAIPSKDKVDESDGETEETPDAPEDFSQKSKETKITPKVEKTLRDKVIAIAQDSALLIYTLAGFAAFVVSAYMEMIAFDSFYPGFFLISVVMVIAFEVAKVGSIFMKVYIKASKTDINKFTLKILGSVFIPLLFGLSIISSMAVTADKLESPHAEELKVQSIKKIQAEYDDVLQLTEKDHLRRTGQLKKDFFEKIAEFENRKKEAIADKDAEIEKQKSVYGTDGTTWKGSKYEEHLKERTTLIGEFAAERMRLENLYNDQVEQESAQYRKEKKEDLTYKTQNLSSAESEVLANSWQAQNEMVRSFIKVVNHGFGLRLKELDFIFMLSILISVLLELTIYKVFSNVAVVYAIKKR